MKTSIHLLAALALLGSVAYADVALVNTTNERMTFEMTLPNGDTEKGEIREDVGYGPSQVTMKSTTGAYATFKVMSESGGTAVEVKAPSDRLYVLAIVDGSMKILPSAWFADDGQTHRREVTYFNATGQPQNFDVVDDKEVRKGMTVEPGKSLSVPAKNGSVTLKLASDERIGPSSPGSFNILHLDTRSPGKVIVSNFGHIDPPRSAPKK